MSKLSNRLAHSINSKLLAPLLLMCLLALCLFYFATQYRVQKLVNEQLNQRVAELAETFAVATETNPEDSNYVRVINSIGAYDDVRQLFLLDDSEQLVIASSRHQYIGISVLTIVDSFLRELLLKGINTRTNAFVSQDSEDNVFAYKVQVISADNRTVKSVTLLIDLDTSRSRAYIQNISLYFISALLALLAVVIVVYFALIRNIILKPIYQLVHSIQQTKRQNAPVISRYTSKDQLGVLTRVYNELILDSFNKQRELTLAREKSVEASKAKSQFLAMITHELRTPLNGVIGMTAKLAEQIEQPEQQEQLKVIRLSADQLLNIINDTLDFSKIEADKLILDLQPFDLVETIHSVVGMFHSQVENKSVELSFEQPSSAIPILVGDSVRLIQVLINLVGNAIKFTEQGYVKISIQVISQQEQSLTFNIDVKDSGIGMSAGQINSLFKEFSQADSSTTRKYGGTGLGLWISKKLISKMGGKITVESQLGEGSLFSTELTLGISDVMVGSPRLNETTKAVELEKVAPMEIMLVEDTEINRMVVMAILDRENIRFSIATNGVEAVELFKEKDFDLILMDCLMPIKDGFDASREIRQIEQYRQVTKATPIIALTANALVDTKNQCLEAGMDEFLTKPVVPEQLQQSVLKWALRRES